eukprot:537174-Amphidinium_carterae.5
MARQDNYKPPRRWTSKQPLPIVAQLDDISVKKEIALENNEDKAEKNRMQTIIKDIQAVEDAINKELSQLMSKYSFKEVDSRTLTPQQLQQVVAIRWVITERPSNNDTKDIKCRFCGKGLSQYINDTDTQTFAATPSSMAMRQLLTIAILKKFSIYTTDVASPQYTS